MEFAEPISIATYDAEWPFVYRAEAYHIQRLGGSGITNIEHFGSTAAQGLRAKPTIDIMAAVVDLSTISIFVDRLRCGGYLEMSDRFSFRRFFRKEAVRSKPSFHLHVISQTAWPTKSERLFRDYLRDHPLVARRYAELKDLLATNFTANREAYTNAKSAFIRECVNRARENVGLPPLLDWEE